MLMAFKVITGLSSLVLSVGSFVYQIYMFNRVDPFTYVFKVEKKVVIMRVAGILLAIPSMYDVLYAFYYPIFYAKF